MAAAAKGPGIQQERQNRLWLLKHALISNLCCSIPVMICELTMN